MLKASLGTVGGPYFLILRVADPCALRDPRPSGIDSVARDRSRAVVYARSLQLPAGSCAAPRSSETDASS